MISCKPLPSDNRPATPQRGAVARPATPQRGTVARAAAGGQARHRLSPSSLRRRLRMPCKTCQVQLQPAKVSAEPSVGTCHSETSAKSSNGFASARSQYKLLNARSTRFNSASGQEEQTWKGCWRAAFAELRPCMSNDDGLACKASLPSLDADLTERGHVPFQRQDARRQCSASFAFVFPISHASYMS